MTTAPDIFHDRATFSFQCVFDGARCELDYQLAGPVMTITHTGVPSALRGRGIAGALTRRALETARVEGWRVVPACSYAAAYLRRHPEYSDLLNTDHGSQ